MGKQVCGFSDSERVPVLGRLKFPISCQKRRGCILYDPGRKQFRRGRKRREQGQEDLWEMPRLEGGNRQALDGQEITEKFIQRTLLTPS